MSVPINVKVCNLKILIALYYRYLLPKLPSISNGIVKLILADHDPQHLGRAELNSGEMSRLPETDWDTSIA